jgi:hypothetical protein
MGSGTVIYVPSFIKIALGICKFMGGGGGETNKDRQHGFLLSLVLFFQNEESKLIQPPVKT